MIDPPMIEETPDAFVAWLETQGDRVFTRRDSCDCPIACYLRSKAPDARVSVTDGTYSVGAYGAGLPGVARSTPNWARQFIHAVDMDGRDRIWAKGAIKLAQKVTP